MSLQKLTNRHLLWADDNQEDGIGDATGEDFYQVTIDTMNKKLSCPCRFWRQFRVPCQHLWREHLFGERDISTDLFQGVVDSFQGLGYRAYERLSWEDPLGDVSEELDELPPEPLTGENSIAVESQKLRESLELTASKIYDVERLARSTPGGENLLRQLNIAYNAANAHILSASLDNIGQESWEQVFAPWGAVQQVVTPLGLVQQVVAPSGSSQQVVSPSGSSQQVVVQWGSAQQHFVVQSQVQQHLAPQSSAQQVVAPWGPALQHFVPQSPVQQHFAPRSSAQQVVAPWGPAQQHFVPQSLVQQHFAPQSSAQQVVAPRGSAQQHFAPLDSEQQRVPKRRLESNLNVAQPQKKRSSVRKKTFNPNIEQ